MLPAHTHAQDQSYHPLILLFTVYGQKSSRLRLLPSCIHTQASQGVHRALLPLRGRGGWEGRVGRRIGRVGGDVLGWSRSRPAIRCLPPCTALSLLSTEVRRRSACHISCRAVGDICCSLADYVVLHKSSNGGCQVCTAREARVPLTKVNRLTAR